MAGADCGWSLHPPTPGPSGTWKETFSRTGSSPRRGGSSSLFPVPGPRLALDLPSTEDVRALGRLVETRLTEIQNAALQLHRALGLADLERRVGILDDCLIDTGAFTPDDAACLYRCLGGDDVAVRDLALTEWRDHESFADYLETTVHTATGRMVPVDSRPTCGHCRDDNGPNQIWIDFLDADDALALAAALKRVRNTKE